MSWLGQLHAADRTVETDWPAVLVTLRDFACPSCQGHRVWRPIGGLVQRLNSYTGFAACRRCGERVFVKRIRRYPKVDPVERAMREYRNAESLHRALPADDRTGVARPLAAIDGVLVFAYVPGVPLSRALRGRTTEARRAILASTGRWFARFHLSVDVEDGDPRFPSRLAYLREQCAALSMRYRSVSLALERLQYRLEALEGRSFSLFLVHGDAKAENFLLSGNRVVAVDVDYRMRGPPEMDLAQFLVQMRVGRLPWEGVGRPDRRGEESSFLAGYACLRPFDREVLEWMETYFTVWLWTCTRRSGFLRRLRADALFQTELTALLDAFEAGEERFGHCRVR